MKVAIVGATGYGGAELIRLLHNHPQIDSLSLHSSSQEGARISDIYPHLNGIVEGKLDAIDPHDLANNKDVVFLSAPAGVASKLCKDMNGPAKVIDLSGDLRLKNPAVYENWYNMPAASEEALQQAVYGLTEWNREKIQDTQLLSNPGCYPTASLLGIGPLIHSSIIDVSSLIIDAKSGTTGAGRSPSPITHFSEMNDNFKIYKVNQHKHIPEIEQIVSQWNNEETNITLSTHLVPMTRGIMATIYAKAKKDMTEESLRNLFKDTYADSTFVRVREQGEFPGTKEVYGTNFCDIGVTYDSRTGRITVVSVIDNLVKGASGQAIQNMNIMCGFEETTGLNSIPIYP